MASDNIRRILQPELLTSEELICILKERCISVGSEMNKQALVELAYRHLIPLPQRHYRANRRGSIMTQKQKSQQCEEKHHSNKSHTNDWSPGINVGGNRSIQGITASSSVERLKPPPSAANSEHKKIRLSNDVKQHSSASANSAAPKDTQSFSRTELTGQSANRQEAMSALAHQIISVHGIKRSAENSSSTQPCKTDDKKAIELAKRLTDVCVTPPEAKKFKPIAIKWP